MATAESVVALIEGALAEAGASPSVAALLRDALAEANALAGAEPMRTYDWHERPLNLSRMLIFREFNSQGRYTRWIPNKVVGAKVAKLEFLVENPNAGSTIYLAPVPHDLIVDIRGDGVDRRVVATVTPSGTTQIAAWTNVDLSSIPDGWHVFDIGGGQQGDTAHPLWMYVAKAGAVGGKYPAGDFAPMQTGSFGIVHEDGPTARWGKAPLAIDPPAMQIRPRANFIPFDYPAQSTQLFRRNLSPYINGDPPYAQTLADGRRTCLNVHAYAYSTITTARPGVVLRDGPYGVGLVPGATALWIGARGTVFFCDSWRFGRVLPNGEIVTLAGWRQGDNGLELVGDWSSIPPERHGLREPWGMVFLGKPIKKVHDTLLAYPDTSVSLPLESIGAANDGVMAHPHAMNPVAFIADSQNNRILRVEFDGHSHDVKPTVTEWATGLSDPWSIAIDEADTLYVTERQANRISMWSSATPQTHLGNLIETPPAGFTLAYIDVNRKVVRVRPRDELRTYPCVLPEGIAYQDGEITWSSKAQSDIRRIDVATREMRVLASFDAAAKAEYAQIALSDGTFGPRGTVFLSTWEVDRMGAPWAFLPDGTQWRVAAMASVATNSGKGGKYEGIGYSMAPAVRGGRLVYSGADYGLVELSLAQPGDYTIDEAKFAAGKRAYDRAGYRLRCGVHGFRQWKDEPLPWGMSPDVDYYLEMNGHARA
jgi:hypothetical protein